MKIIIYIVHTCSWCDKLKVWLKKHKYEYEEWDVAEPQNKQARDDLLNKSNQLAVPMIDIDGQILVGFDEEKLEEAIANSQGA